MGRPKIVRKPEEAANVPQDQPIQVELPPEGTIELETKTDANQEADKKAAESTVSTQDDRDETITTLKKQLADLEKSSETHRTAAEEARKREQALQKRSAEQEKELKTSVSARHQAEYDAVINAIGAATAEQEAAETALRVAGENQDWGAIAKAQAQLAKSSSRLDRLEEAKITIENRVKEAEEEAKRPQPQQVTHGGDPVEAHIDNIPNINQAQRDWLKSHRELVTNNSKNTRLQNAHLEALEDKGLSPGTQPYFDYLEVRLGYKKAESLNQDDDDDRSPAIVSAPPSRDVPSAGTGRPSNTRVTLSAAEREAARSAGISDIEYAKQKLALAEAKKSGRYVEN